MKHDTPRRLYKSRVPMMILTGESMLPSKNSSNVTEQSLTNKREHMPQEIADTIDICSHQHHDLHFA